jgi:hypothetical protein
MIRSPQPWGRANPDFWKVLRWRSAFGGELGRGVILEPADIRDRQRRRKLLEQREARARDLDNAV